MTNPKGVKSAPKTDGCKGCTEVGQRFFPLSFLILLKYDMHCSAKLLAVVCAFLALAQMAEAQSCEQVLVVSPLFSCLSPLPSNTRDNPCILQHSLLSRLFPSLPSSVCAPVNCRRQQGAGFSPLQVGRDSPESRAEKI